MPSYDISGVVTNSNQTEQLNTLNWFKTNYGSAITSATTRSDTKDFKFTLNETTFANIATILNAIATEYTSRFTIWRVSYIV